MMMLENADNKSSLQLQIIISVILILANMAIVGTVAQVVRAADQWAAEPATVDEVLDAQDWARDRARRVVEHDHAGTARR